MLYPLLARAVNGRPGSGSGNQHFSDVKVVFHFSYFGRYNVIGDTPYGILLSALLVYVRRWSRQQ
jgi:hypothetical protein